MQGPPNVQTMPLEVEQAELSDNTPDLISYLRFGEGAKLFGVPPGKKWSLGPGVLAHKWLSVGVHLVFGKWKAMTSDPL